MDEAQTHSKVSLVPRQCFGYQHCLQTEREEIMDVLRIIPCSQVIVLSAVKEVYWGGAMEDNAEEILLRAPDVRVFVSEMSRWKKIELWYCLKL